MSLEPLNSSLECTLFARLDLGVTQVTTDREPMTTSIKVFPLVTGLEFALLQDLISYRLRFGRELRVNGAAIDQEGGFCS